MFAAMIKHKTGYCIDCPDNQSQQLIIAGRCQTHYWQYRNKISQDRKKCSPKKNATVSIKRKTPIKRSPIQKNTGTKAWMEYHIAEAEVENKWFCENCGSAIDSFTEQSVFGAQAHILPKNDFPSVKNVIENHLLLNRFVCFCHNTFDSSWERASRMPIFPKAWHIVNDKLKHLLNPEELRRLPVVFNQPLKNINNEEI